MECINDKGSAIKYKGARPSQSKTPWFPCIPLTLLGGFQDNIVSWRQKEVVKRFKKKEANRGDDLDSRCLEMVSDESSIDSLDSMNSALIKKVSHVEVMQIACHNWSHVLHKDVKESWRDRAAMLNHRPLRGKFEKVPRELGRVTNGRCDEVMGNLLQNLTIEWENMVKLMKRCITRPPKTSDSQKEYCFGHEWVVLHSQTYRTFTISLLLRLCIFGNNYEKLTKNEVIQKTNRTVLLHISSQRRMCELFTLEGQCATAFDVYRNGEVMMNRVCSGKVNLIDTNKKNITGYIVDEINGRWKIQMESNCIIWKDMLLYNEVVHRYEYPIARFLRGKSISCYWPVRLLINRNGQ